MPELPEAISKAWDDRKGPVIFTTVDNQGVPNAIYATCVSKYDESSIVIADNYFDKTQKNILAGSQGSVLFMTNTDKAFQLKGTIEYHKDGAVFEDMKRWNPQQHPGHAAAVLKVGAAYSGATKLL
ncbi:MAG: pyridoxamine 5'-phosphate oxidase family protein [Kiritimatiellae bacterium]|nr:pyridoxamine 5'-phosphate oxidase family protein [Kiritimatiellia bacterium]MDD4341045.1 pyridoxamine 5'-phosphate oxidase family protein [Kiritimatiellia bacterium]